MSCSCREDHGDLTCEQSASLEETTTRGLTEPMPPELREMVKDLIEPHTLNTDTKHRNVMECIDAVFPWIRDYLRAHPEAR